MKDKRDFIKAQINRDLDDRYIEAGQYRDLTNARVLGSAGSHRGAVERIDGMKYLSEIPLLDGFSVIGLCSHNDYLFYVATNLIDNTVAGDYYGNRIGRYNKETDEHEFIIFESEVGGSSSLLFDLNKDTLIFSMRVFEGLLIFCDDKRSEPYKINIEKCIADNSYYESRNDVLLIKSPPPEPISVGVIDEDNETNFLKGEALQFASRFTYEDGEVSAISSYSGTAVEFLSQGTLAIDGSIGYIFSSNAVLYSGVYGIIIGRTEDGFNTISKFAFEAPTSTSYGLDNLIRSIDISNDGSIVSFCSTIHYFIMDFSDPDAPEILLRIDLQDGDVSMTGSAISGDGNTKLFTAVNSQDDSNIRTYKYTAGTGVVEVDDLNTGESDLVHPGSKIAMSSAGDIVYIGVSHRIRMSSNFGDEGTWSEAVDLDDIATGDGDREVISLCCSADGDIVYCLAAEELNGSGGVYLFRSRNTGADWDEVYINRNIDRKVRAIDCSSDGGIVAFVTNGESGSPAKIFVSISEGNSMVQITDISPDAINFSDVTVSTTGQRIVVSGVDNDLDKTIIIATSVDFGTSFDVVTHDDRNLVSNNLVGIASVNNEESLAGTRGLNNIDNLANRIDITYSTGNKHVTDIEMIVRVIKSNNMFIIASFNKESLSFSDNEIKTLSFRNDGSYIAVAQKDTNKLFDNVPLKAKCFEITQNALIFANYTDGKSITNPDGTKITANVDISFLSSEITDGETSRGLKTGSNNEYVLIYFDSFNRSSTALSIGEVAVPSAGLDIDNPVKTAVLSISHLAPSWAVKYKVARKAALLDYNIVDGFDNVYIIDSEVYLEITTYTGIVPRINDTVELFSELNTSGVGDPYVISQGSMRVPILRYVDALETGTQDVAVTLSTGETDVRVDSSSNDTASPVPKGRYIVINPVDLENYNEDSINKETSRFQNSLFYIIKNANIEDELMFQEIPGEFSITDRYHGTNAVKTTGDRVQDETSSAIVSLSNDYDIVWGQLPTREIYKYDNITDISNLGRPNFVSENAREEDRFASLIASELFVDDTNVNGLSSFNLSLIPFKDLDKTDGEIQLINSEDTNVEVYQVDKISSVLYRKNVLTTATGDQQVTQTRDVWGEQVRSRDEYGISHPESYSEWGGVRYYVDAKRGIVLRKSSDGQTEISSYGMLDFFHDLLKVNKTSRIRGYYEPKYNNYVVAVGNDDHLYFAERSNAWESRYTFFPDKVVNDGFSVFSFKDGKFYKHEASEIPGDFYNVIHDTVIKFFFNDTKDIVKTITAMSINGSIPDSVVITTEDQKGTLLSSDFETVEGLLFSKAPLDQTNLEVDFAGVIRVASSDNRLTVDNINSTYIHIGDEILINESPLVTLGNCVEIDGDVIVIDNPAVVNAGDVVLARGIGNENGDALKGRVIGVEITYSSSDENNVLNSVEIEVDESKQ